MDVRIGVDSKLSVTYLLHPVDLRCCWLTRSFLLWSSFLLRCGAISLHSLLSIWKFVRCCAPSAYCNLYTARYAVGFVSLLVSVAPIGLGVFVPPTALARRSAQHRDFDRHRGFFLYYNPSIGYHLDVFANFTLFVRPFLLMATSGSDGSSRTCSFRWSWQLHGFKSLQTAVISSEVHLFLGLCSSLYIVMLVQLHVWAVVQKFGWNWYWFPRRLILLGNKIGEGKRLHLQFIFLLSYPPMANPIAADGGPSDAGAPPMPPAPPPIHADALAGAGGAHT